MCFVKSQGKQTPGPCFFLKISPEKGGKNGVWIFGGFSQFYGQTHLGENDDLPKWPFILKKNFFPSRFRENFKGKGGFGGPPRR